MPSDEKAVNDDDARKTAIEPGAQVRVAAAIIDVARELKRSMPAPRAAPYFGLDIDVGYDPAGLESLSSRGIFRKYELVLLVGSGLGGVARWLSRRLGCRILGIEPDVDATRAAARLNDAAGMSADVSFTAGEAGELPFRDRVFTHVWMIDPDARERQVRPLKEAFRVLRSGAHFAVQIPGTDRDEVASLRDALEAAGFLDFSLRGATMVPPSHAAGVAGERLHAALACDDRVRGGWRSARLDHPQVFSQIFCKRP